MPEINFSNETPAAAIATAPLQAMSPEARNALLRHSTSRSQRRIQEDVETARRELEASGMLKPATIINFNPVPLVQDGLINKTVPAAGFSQTGRVDWEFQGRTFVGHMMTIHSPLIYSRVDSTEADPDTMSDVPKLEAKYILPIGIAYHFWEHYSGPSKDSPMMGGILIFEGDKHTLSEEKLEKAGRMLMVPEPVRLPKNRRSFTTKPQSLDDLVAKCFEMQAEYTDSRIQSAHELWSSNDPMQIKQITNIHRLWDRYGVDKGWYPELAPWVHAKHTASGTTAVVRCPVCSKAKPFPNIYLCPDCRAPYDAFEAFMAGMPVPQQYLDMLEGEQLALVAAEMEARESRFKKARAKAKSDAKNAPKDADDAPEGDD